MSFGVSSIGGSSADNCGMVVPMWRGWRDWPCVSSNVITCACQHEADLSAMFDLASTLHCHLLSD